MRARFAAYALANVGFIFQTERPDPPRSTKDLGAQRRSLKQFCQSTQFLGLQIMDEETLENDQATVTFHATLLQQGQDASFTEQSLFKKANGRWYYIEPLPQH